MNWLTKALRFGEKIKKVFKKRPSKEEIENSNWTALNCCTAGPKLKSELEENLMVCPNFQLIIINPRKFNIHFGKIIGKNKALIPTDDPFGQIIKDRLKLLKNTGQIQLSYRQTNILGILNTP